jgi:hypothetical protein
MKGKPLTYLVFLTLCISSNLFAQHEHHNIGNMKKDSATAGVAPMKMLDTMHHDMEDMGLMSHSLSRNLAMNRNSSGTSWLPDASPMYGHMIMFPKSMLMLHGSIFLRYTNQDIFNKGSRGGSGFSAPNWFMGMYQKPVGKKGLFAGKVMISFDPLTVGKHGYPLLFQTGETFKGEKLVDHQHPHDLFDELSLSYSYAFSKDVDAYGYVGYPAEPALGPPTFMHRPSAMSNPDAPLGHHWQDATHISFGVGTVGLRYKMIKLEGSIFNGNEPNEERYNFDKLYLNSYSYRVSVNPATGWALQFSQGFLDSPEALEPGVDVTRTTASVIYSKNMGNNRHYDISAVWGYNNSTNGHNEHTILIEDNHRISKSSVYFRYEFAQKNGSDLNVSPAAIDSTYNLNAFTAGYNVIFFGAQYFEGVIGFQSTFNFPPKSLQYEYGKMPIGLEFYIQIRPKLIKMK